MDRKDERAPKKAAEWMYVVDESWRLRAGIYKAWIYKNRGGEETGFRGSVEMGPDYHGIKTFGEAKCLLRKALRDHLKRALEDI